MTSLVPNALTIISYIPATCQFHFAHGKLLNIETSPRKQPRVIYLKGDFAIISLLFYVSLYVRYRFALSTRNFSYHLIKK